MGLDLAAMRDDLWANTGTTSDDLSSSALDHLLNLSWWEIQDKLGFREKEGEASFNTVAGQEAYDVLSEVGNDIESIQQVFLQPEDSEEYVELTYRDHGNFMRDRSDDTTNRSAPEKYSRFGADLLLQPIPDQVYAIRVKYLKTLDDLSSGGPPVPQAWHEAIALGAEYRIWRRLGDFTRRDQVRAERDTLVATLAVVPTKERTSQHAAIQLLQAPYP